MIHNKGAEVIEVSEVGVALVEEKDQVGLKKLKQIKIMGELEQGHILERGI